MESLELQIKLLSPAFIAGADQRLAELRAASVKGLIRWWWRAACADPKLGSKELLLREGGIFGAAGEGVSCKAPFSCELWLDASDSKVIRRGSPGPSSSYSYDWQKKGKTGKAQALHYIGYAVIRIPTKDERNDALAGKDPELIDPLTRQPFNKPVYVRPAYAEGTRFNLRLSWERRKLPDAQRSELLQALAAWIVFGGLGSRSRKGFGALELSGSIPDLLMPFWQKMRNQLETSISGAVTPDLPPFPSLRNLVVLGSFSAGNWRDALGQAAIAYRTIRPKAGASWVAGSAKPRRASSVFITLTEEANGEVTSWLYAMPCRRAATSDVDQDHRQWEEFLRVAKASLAALSLRGGIGATGRGKPGPW